MRMAKRRHRGEGSVYFDETRQLYVGMVSLGVRSDGKRDRRVVYAKTKPECVAELRKLYAQSKEPRPTDGPLLRDYLTSWLKILWESGCKPRTHEAYERSCLKHIIPYLGGVPVAKLQATHAHELFRALAAEGRPAYTQKYAFRVLRTSLSYAVEPLKYIPSNPMFGVKAPKTTTKTFTTWTPEQCNTFIASASDHWYRAAFVMSVDLGMREGEILALQWADNVDMAARTVRVTHTLQVYKGKILGRGEPKTVNSKRLIPMTDRVYQALVKQREAMLASGLAASPWVIPTKSGGPVNPSNYIRAYGRAVRAVNGLPYIRPHDMRHSHATILVRNGVDPKAVADRLGHDVTTTMRTYVHSDLNHQRSVGERFTAIMEGAKDG